MKRNSLLRLIVLSLWMIGNLLLAGCPNPPSKEEIKQIENRAIESFEQAMLRYGFEREAYEVSDVFVDAYINSSHPVTHFTFKIGNAEYFAEVVDDTSEVFTSYYAKEFKAALEKYFCEQVERSGALSGGTYELTAEWIPSALSIHASKEWGLVSADIMPEDFEAFIEKNRENNRAELEVEVSIKYYSPEDNLTMNKMNGLFDLDAKNNFYLNLWTCEFYECEPEEADNAKLFAKYQYSYVTQKVTVEYVTTFGQ